VLIADLIPEMDTSSRRSSTSTASDLNHCLDGLTEEQARRLLVPSRTTLLGLVKHAASSGKSGSTKPSPTGRAEIGTETADLRTVMRLNVRIEART
jgi:Protein of unknown function (DUF664)